MDQKFIDKIESLRHNTYSRITDIQNNICPMVRKMYLNHQYEYWYDGYRYTIWEEDTQMYATKDVPWCYDNELKNTVFMGNLKTLIDEDKIWPFLMFVNGHVIPWSDITILHDYDYTYLRIDNIKDNYSFYADLIVFPLGSKKIRYGEDNNVLLPPNRKGFYFGTDGYRLENTDFVDILVRLEILDDNIYYREINLKEISDNTLVFEDLPDGYVPSLSNILIFNEDGKFNHLSDEVIEDKYNSAYNIFNLLENEDAKWAILMYNTYKANVNASYLYDREEDFNKKKILNLLKNNDTSSEIWQDVIEPLIQTFDFDHEFGTDYDINIENATKYITQYDFRLWRDTFTKDLNIKSFTYTGKEFKDLADDRGYVHFSRKHTDLVEDVVMMFVNSKLYEYSIDIYYTTNTINIPIFGLYDDDHVEIVMFHECNNNILEIVVPDDNTPVYIHPEYDLDKCDIMADYHPRPEYDVPEDPSGRRQYDVSFEYTKDSDNNYLIEFEEPDYYGKTLKIVPKKQFRYYRFKQRPNQYKIILPTQFNYCHDPNRYMIFINGKKLDQFGDTKFVDERPIRYEINIDESRVATMDQVSDSLTFDISEAAEQYPTGYKYQIMFTDASSIPVAEQINGVFGEGENIFTINFDYELDYILGLSIADQNDRFIGIGSTPVKAYVPNSAKTGEYAITIMNKNRPFSKLILYLSTILDEGDYIDIFYLPESIVEKYKQLRMPNSGLILLDDEEGEEKNYPTTYPLSKYTSMVFVNGLKVNPLDIKDVSLNSLLINVDKYNRDEDDEITSESRTYIDSVDNITIMEYVVGNEEVAQYLDETRSGEYSDKWKDLIETLLTKYNESGKDYAGLQYIFGNIHELENPADNYKDSFAELKSILYDVVIDYYLDKVNTGEPFVYDFRREAWKPETTEETDSTDITKLITLTPNHDKLLDYETVEDIADENDVLSGQLFIPAGN